MVRLAYKCPESGVIILGAFFSETTLMRYHDSTALVECPSCGPAPRKVFECRHTCGSSAYQQSYLSAFGARARVTAPHGLRAPLRGFAWNRKVAGLSI